MSKDAILRILGYDLHIRQDVRESFDSTIPDWCARWEDGTGKRPDKNTPRWANRYYPSDRKKRGEK